MTATTDVDLDDVLLVADELRRLGHRYIRAGVAFGVFKQESLDAALAYVQDLHEGRQPVIRSDAPFFRLLASCPPKAWRWEHLQPLQGVRVFDGRGESYANTIIAAKGWFSHTHSHGR